MIRKTVARFFLLLSTILALVLPAGAAEVRVMMSSGYAEAFLALVPEFERATGHKVIDIRGPSMGDTPQAIPNRLQRGEAADLFIIVGSALDGLIRDGKALPDTRADLAQSGIGMAVRAETPHPDISSVDALKRTLLAARSIAYSDSASGVYMSTVLLPRLGVYDLVKHKSRMIPAEPVGNVVARGEADIGFQQISELKNIKGIDLVGPLPEGAQKFTVFSAAVAAGAAQPEAARALIRFLASPAAAAAVKDSGMELLSSAGAK